jgi:predicted lipoprotein with Yx(FWY)xxD motif
MHTLRRTGLICLIGLGVVALAGCGSGGGAYGYGPGSGSNPTDTPSASGVMIKTHTATVGGTAKTVLTNASGLTLYYFDPDTAQSVACSGACANTWPPLAAGGGRPSAEGAVTGALSVLDGANGKQVEYNSHPLYTYSGDTAAGQATGDGIGGKWHVATPDTPLNANGTPPLPNY